MHFDTNVYKSASGRIDFYEVLTNVLFFISENQISGIIYSLFRGRQNIFLATKN